MTKCNRKGTFDIVVPIAQKISNRSTIKVNEVCFSKKFHWYIWYMTVTWSFSPIWNLTCIPHVPLSTDGWPNKSMMSLLLLPILVVIGATKSYSSVLKFTTAFIFRTSRDSSITGSMYKTGPYTCKDQNIIWQSNNIAVNIIFRSIQRGWFVVLQPTSFSNHLDKLLEFSIKDVFYWQLMLACHNLKLRVLRMRDLQQSAIMARMHYSELCANDGNTNLYTRYISVWLNNMYTILYSAIGA